MSSDELSPSAEAGADAQGHTAKNMTDTDTNTAADTVTTSHEVTPPILEKSQPPQPGVATSTVAPNARRSRRMRDWILPRSVLGMTALILSFALGASLSGAVLYSYYTYELTRTEKTVNTYIKGFDGRYRAAVDTIEAVKQNAEADMQKETESLRQNQAEGGTSSALAQKVNKSVWFVSTLDKNGAPSVGSAFVVQSDGNQSVLVTSYATVEAATHTPAPGITLSDGNDKIKATLSNWVPEQDLAVLTAPRGNLPKLEWVSADTAPRMGDRTFVASGLGAVGASITQGFVTDVAQNALQISAPLGAQFQGGPILNTGGKVTGVASLRYAPFNFASSPSMTYGIPIRNTCDKLLHCPTATSSGGDAQKR